MLDLLLTAVVFLIIDSIYLNLSAPHFRRIIKNIQGSPLRLNFLATALTYVVLIFGIYYFIIQRKKSIWEAALLGFTIYAVYELTTMATIKKWTWGTVVMDTIWGSILFALTTWVVYSLSKLLKI